ncbi:MAG TPA: hypothetical protein ENI99_02905 [Sedimenticola sp.]|nr:hypothetical protein [Sedimenticola sp.]
MQKIILIVFLLILAGCSSDVPEDDAAYVSAILEDLKLGNSIEKVRRFFEKHGHTLQIYDNCKMAMVQDIAPCDQGYRSTGIIKLPSKSKKLGEGRAQIYLKFDSNGALSDYFHDLYYDNY